MFCDDVLNKLDDMITYSGWYVYLHWMICLNTLDDKFIYSG